LLITKSVFDTSVAERNRDLEKGERKDPTRGRRRIPSHDKKGDAYLESGENGKSSPDYWQWLDLSLSGKSVSHIHLIRRKGGKSRREKPSEWGGV